MFRVQTVFVVGAGAGVDVGMPTGDTLSKEIATKVNIVFEGGTTKISGDDSTFEEMRQISRRERIDLNKLMAAGRRISKGIHYTRSIDSYIHTHKEDELITICGKLGIIQTILEHEKTSKLFVNMTKHPFIFRDDAGVRQSWFGKFMLVLQDGIIAKENLDDIFKKVMIINFNYDRCIEQFLYWALQDLYGIDGGRAAELIANLKIYHPYGVVAPLPWQAKGGGLEFGGNPYGHDDYRDYISNIKTFNEEVDEGSTDLQVMREIVAASKRFVFLGFHFHKQNLELIKPRSMPADATIGLYATALDRSEADVGVIKDNLYDVFSRKVAYGPQEFGTRWDCNKLFTEFGTRFGS